MIIKPAKYKKVRKLVNVEVLVSPEIVCCDECKKKVGQSYSSNEEITVFHENSPVERFVFCSWKCTLKFVPKIKTGYFATLPHLNYDTEEKGWTVSDFLKACKTL